MHSRTWWLRGKFLFFPGTETPPHHAAHGQSLYWMTYPQHIYRAHIIAVPYSLVFCDVMLQSMANGYPCFRGTCCHHLQGRRWKILVTWHVIHFLTHCHTPQHWIQLYGTIPHNILQDHKIQVCHTSCLDFPSLMFHSFITRTKIPLQHTKM